MNKKAQQSLTKTGVLFAVIVFYSVIIVFIGASQNVVGNDQIQYEDSRSGFESFSFQVITGIASLPLAINFILFTPLVIIIGWLVISSLPFFNGGG